MKNPENRLGLLNINKPAGMTSRDVVNRIQTVSGQKRIGHAGTLDPGATGVLVVLLGQATRLTSYVQQAMKSYEARFRFQLTSSTDDIWGECKNVEGNEFSEATLRQALATFVGEIQQTPPNFSAVKVDGRRAYKLARQGKAVTLKPRTVSVYRIQLLDFQFPECSVQIDCGSGTYIRSIARDLGEHLSCPAVMSKLARTRIGRFELTESTALDDLNSENLDARLIDSLVAVDHLPKLKLTSAEQSELYFGRRVLCPTVAADQNEVAAIDDESQLLAILERRDELHFKPKINFLPVMQASRVEFDSKSKDSELS